MAITWFPGARAVAIICCFGIALLGVLSVGSSVARAGLSDLASLGGTLALAISFSAAGLGIRAGKRWAVALALLLVAFQVVLQLGGVARVGLLPAFLGVILTFASIQIAQQGKYFPSF